MKNFKVAVLLDLVDRLSGPMKGPIRQLSTLESQAKRTDTALDRLATGGKFIAAGALIAAPLIIGINKVSSFNEALNKNKVLLGDHARSVQKWAKDGSTAFGISESKTVEATGSFAALFRGMNIGQGPAAKMSMNLTKLAGDMASFNDIRDPTRVVDALRSGLVGESEPLRALSVNLSASLVAKKAFDAGMVRTPTPFAQLPDSIKALATYQLILEKTKLQQGDFARTSNGMANAMRTSTQLFDDLHRTLTTQLEPVFNPLLLGFRNTLFAVNRFAEANPFLARVLALTTLGVAALLVVVGSGIITLATFTLATAQARIGLFRLGVWTRNVTAAMRLYVTGGAATAAQTQLLSGRFATLNLALAYTRARFAAATTAARVFWVSMLASVQLRIAALRALGLSGALQIVRVGLVNATRAAWAFSASLLTNPVFLLIAVITLLGGSFVYAWRKSDEFRANVMRGLSPITRAWAGLKDDVASLGRAFGPLGTIFRGVMQRMGIDLSLVQRPLDALAYGFGYFIGFVGTATAIVFGRMIATLTTGLGGVVQIVDGLVTAAHGLVTLDFAKMMEGLDKASGGLQQIMLSPLELAGIDSKQFRDDLNSAGGKARAWQRQIGTWLGEQVKTGALNPRNLLDGLNRASEATSSWGIKLHDWIGQSFRTSRIQAQNLMGSMGRAGERAKTWLGDMKGRIGEQIRAGALRPENLIESLQRAGVRVSGWRTRLQAQIGRQFQAAGIDAATFTAALTTIGQRTAGWRGYIAGLVGEQWQMQKADFAGFLGSLREAREKGAAIWGRIPNWLGKRVAAGEARVGDFLGSLREGKTEGSNIWARAATVLAKKIRLPGIDWTAVQTTLRGMLEHITNFGPNLLAAGEGLIGSLITGIQNKLGDLANVFAGIKLPDWVPGGNRGETPADRATATAGAAAPPIANRVGTPDAMRPVVGRGVSPNITFTPEQLVKFSGVNPGSEYGKLLVQGLAQGVMTERQVANFAVDRMAADVEATFRRRLGIQSPSRVFMGLGSMVTQGLGRGIVGQRSLVTGAMRTLAAAALAVPVTAQLGVPALGDELAIPAPPAIGRAASEPSRGERSRAEARAASEGRAQTKTVTFPNAIFNFDMSGVEDGMGFIKEFKSLLDGIGNDE